MPTILLALLACADPETSACYKACDLWEGCATQYEWESYLGVNMYGAELDPAVWADGCRHDCDAAAEAGLYTERDAFAECVLAEEDLISLDPPDRTACYTANDCAPPCRSPSAAAEPEYQEDWVCQ